MDAKNNIQLTAQTIITVVKEILFNFLDDENLLGAMVDERVPMADSAQRHTDQHSGACEFPKCKMAYANFSE